MIGIKDLKSKDQTNFEPSELTICSPTALFINTGRLVDNPDLEMKPYDTPMPELKFNDFVVYDEN